MKPINLKPNGSKEKDLPIQDGFSANGSSPMTPEKEEDHICMNKGQFSDLWREIKTIKEDRRKDWEELVKRDESIKKAFDENTSKLGKILDEVRNLKTGLELTKQQNGFQDKQIEGINVAEREKIRNRWVIIGIVVGAIVGPFIIKCIEYLTPL